MSDLFHKPLPPEARANLQPEITIIDMIQCVKRELGFRARCYPAWVRKKTMTQADADRQIDVMTAVLRELEDLQRAGVVSSVRAP